MKLQKNEKRLLKIMATVFVVGGIAVYYLSQPPEFKAIPPRKGLETSTEKPSESPAPTNTASPSRGSSRGSSRGGGSGDTSSSSLGSIGVSTFESRNTAKSCWVLI